MLRSLPLLALALLAAAGNASVLLEEFPPAVDTPWRKCLVPCSCVNGTLDCSERRKRSLAAGDVACEGPVTALQLAGNVLVALPEGFHNATVVNASRNWLERIPLPSQLSADLRELDLRDNRISDANDELRSLVALTSLRLSKNNGLKHLRFLPQPCSLVRLEVASNAIDSLHGPLRECTNLQILDVSDNNLTSLSDDAFASLVDLRVLDVSWNRIGPFTRQTFATLTRLTELRLDGTGQEFLPERLFENLSDLAFLSLDGNLLTSVSTSAFYGLTRLTYLSVSSSQMMSFPENGFGNLSSLEELHLAGNGLSSIPSAAFASLPHLKLINLVSNNLSSLTVDAFTGLPSLDALFLTDNDQSLVIPTGLVASLRNLHLISMSVNIFQNQLLQALTNVPYIQCINCGVTSLPPRAFSSLLHTKALSIESNAIQSIAEDAFDGLQTLTYLSLGANSITTLPVLLFSPLKNLTRLHLWNNSLTTLPENIFSRLECVTELTLNNNSLSEIPRNIFRDMRSLQRLDLSYNLLTVLPLGIFTNLSSLWELNVGYNRITILPAFPPDCTSLKAVSFEHNFFTDLNEGALRSWLSSGGGERYVNLVDRPSRIHPTKLDWILQMAEVSVSDVEDEDEFCGAVRRESNLIRFCVMHRNSSSSSLPK